MMDVKDEFQRYYSKTLKSFIKGDTGGNFVYFFKLFKLLINYLIGHYKHGLYALCGETRDK